MRFSFTKQTVLGAAAAIIIIVGLVAAWFLIPRPLPDAASYLPADRTVAVFQNVNRTSVLPFVPGFPILGSIPLTDTPVTIAILRAQTGGMLGWATLTRTTKSAQPFTVRASTADVRALLTATVRPLSRSYTYGVLLPDQTTSTWAYVRFPDMPLSPQSPVNRLLTVRQPASITVVPDGLSIRFLGPSSAGSLPALPAAPKDVFAHPLFIAEVADLGDVLLEGASLLHGDIALVSQSVLRQSLASLFGTEISPRYDLVPLLHGPTTLQVATGSSINLRVVLEGTVTDGSATDAMNTLVQKFKSTLTPITRESQTFDGKFTFEDVRQDPSLISDTGGHVGSWDTRIIRQTQTQASLFIATRGSEFVLSNDTTAFNKTLTAPSPSFPATEAAPAGLGLIQSNEAAALLQRSLPTVWKNLTIPSGTGGYLKWKLDRDGRQLTIVIKKV